MSSAYFNPSTYDPREHGAQCERCPLKGGVVVPREANSGAEVCIIGEAPGESEENAQRPFVGASGMEMQRGLRSAGLRRSDCYITNVLNCRPPGNDLKKLLRKISKENKLREKAYRAEKKRVDKEGGAAPVVPTYIPTPMECCEPRLERELADFTNFITMGKTATTAATGASASILKIRGGLMELEATDKTPARKVMPTIHPAFVLRAPRWAHVFRNDLHKAIRWFRGEAGWTPPKMTFNPSAEDLDTFLYAHGKGPYTFDIETDGIECLTAKIRCIAIGTGDDVMVVSLLGRDGITRFYPEEEERRVINVMKEFFEDPTRVKCGHNAGYYDRIILESQWGISPSDIIDTIMLHRNVESELPHGLAYVASLFTEAPSWKSDREGNKLATDAESDEELAIYCCNDVAITARVLAPLADQVRLRDQLEVWKMDQKVQSVCADMHTIGMHVDQKRRLAKEKELLARRYTLLTEIRDFTGRPEFNPGSVYQVRDLLFDTWQLEVPLEDDERLTASDDPSTADIVLRALLMSRDVPKEQRGLIKLLRYYRKVQKVLGTYVVKLRPWNMEADVGWDDEDEWVDKETRKRYGEVKRGIVNPATGRMYPGWNAHVTACVVPGTWLITPNGPRQIGIIDGFGPAHTEREAGGLNLHDGSAFAEVSHLQNPGVCQTLRVETVLGIELIGTPHHRVRRAVRGRKFSKQIRSGVDRGKWLPVEPPDEWVRLDNIQPHGSDPRERDTLRADYIKIPIGMNVWGDCTELPLVERLPTRTNANEVWLPAVTDEDLGLFMGAYNADGSLHDGNGSFSIRLSDTTGKPEMDEVEEAAKRLFGSVAVRRDREALHVTSISLAGWCEALEFKRGIVNKHIPSWLLSAPKPVVLAYIKGLSLDSNVSLNSGITPIWHYSGSKELAQSLQMLLLNLGIPAGLQDERVDRSPNTWGLVVCGEAVSAIVAITGQDVPLPTREGSGSQARPKYIRRGNTLWLRVKTVRDAGRQQVFDVTIPTTHQFWANGTVSHNTGRLSSSRPINAQNFPYAMREMITAAPGNILVGADADQLEIRVAAAHWEIERYLQAFREGKDPHSMTAFMVFGERFCKAAGITADQFDRPGKLVGEAYDESGTFIGKGEVKDLRSLSKNVHFACVDKDEPVVVLGPQRQKPISDLVPGDWTWTWATARKRYEPSQVKTVLQKGVKECVRVVFEWWGGPRKGRCQGLMIVTDDHRCLLRDGTYRAAGQLQPEDRLMPFRRRQGGTCGPYSRVFPFNDNRECAEHRVVAGFYEKDPTHVHHEDEDTLNNNPYNLKQLSSGAHTSTHAEKLTAARVASPKWQAGVTNPKVNQDPVKKALAAKKGGETRRGKRQKSKFAPWADRIGHEPDKVIATEAGATREGVAYYRKVRGIPAYWREAPGGNNHKVVSVEPVGLREVWDIEVDHEDHNFALASGVFVHNSQYMAGVERVHKMIQGTETQKDDGTTDLPYALLPLRKVRKMRENWLGGAPEYELGWEREINLFRSQGYLAEPVTGRRRDFLDGENPNELANFPIQAGAAGLMNISLLQLAEAIPRNKWGPGTGIIGQVHDWIGVECPEDKADEVIGLLEECMNQTHPNLPGVKFTATAEKGHSWDKV